MQERPASQITQDRRGITSRGMRIFQMIIHRAKSGSGIFFGLEKEDFRLGDWKGFLAQVKRLEKAVYKPVEINDPDEEWWWIGNECVSRFLMYKKAFLDDTIAREKQYQRDGYEPIPRPWRRPRSR